MPKILANVKDDICRSARKLLDEEGYESLSIRGIASLCGIGMGTVYNYFHSKEEIVAEIVISDWTVILRRMDQANRASGDPVERLRVVFDLLQDYIVGYHATWMQMSLAPTKDCDAPETKCRRQDYRHQLAERIAAAAGIGMDPLEPFCADLIARIFLSYSPEPGFRFEKLVPALKGLLSDGGCRLSK